MDIGSKLKQARLEAGLSQRQLCADVITRNMLSLIENGSARPSMDTLAYLAERLKKPISFFLEEGPALSTNAACMEKARAAYEKREFAGAQTILQEYQGPDGALDNEFSLLKTLILLSLAESALNRPIYAKELLEEAGTAMKCTCYATWELEQRRLLLLSQVNQEPINLPNDDRPLLCRAQNALKEGNATRCVTLLDACEDRHSVHWHYLRAEAAFMLGDYAQAAEHYPPDSYAKLEECYRNLGDYKKAYEYACKQR